MRAVTVVLLLVALALVGAACSGDDGDEPAAPTAAPTTPAGSPTSLYDLAIGDCFSGLGRNQDLRIRVKPCAGRHQAEVYGSTGLTAPRFPGVEVLRQRAATDCAQLFAGYTGEPAGPGTELAFAEVVPTLESWAAGDRRALCIAVGVDGAPLRGSIAAGGAT